MYLDMYHSFIYKNKLRNHQIRKLVDELTKI